MSWKTIGWAIVIWTVTANTAFAGVRINEIAWMGTTESANDEWMELENNGDTSIDLTGWHLIAQSGAPEIALEGSILPKGYFLLERTSDATVSYVIANQIYTGALSNSGTTLTLTDSIGNTVDQVVGGANWVNVGGDNTTKDTAQRTSASWQTASPTPGAVNVRGGEVLGASTGGSQSASTEAVVASSSNATPSSSTGIKSPYPRKNITVFAGDDKVAFVDFPVVFSGRALGLYDESINYGTYRWNFGDGATGEGETVTHTYGFTGEYVVTLEVFRGESKNTDRLTTAVINPTVLISKVVVGDGGFVELINHSSREIDLSRWRLEGSIKKDIFILPPHTVLLPGKTLVLPNTITKQGLDNGGLELTSPDGVVVHSWNLIPTAVIPIETNTASNLTTKESSTKSRETPQASQEIAINVAATAESVIWSASKSPEGHRNNAFSWFLGDKKWVAVLTTLLLALFACFIVMRSQEDEEGSTEEKYRIIEDIIEGEEGP